MITLVTGGGRSGKSRYAMESAAAYRNRVFIATAVAMDGEMAERIRRHKTERGESFLTIEEPLDLAGALRSITSVSDVVVVDCLTVWLGNLMHEGRVGQGMQCAEVTDFLGALETVCCDVFLVTNEVGMGIIPHNEMARRFRDLAGSVNQRVAAKAQRAIVMISGLPVVIKGDA